MEMDFCCNETKRGDAKTLDVRMEVSADYKQ